MFYKIREIVFFVFFNVYNENMFKIEIENGCEAPLKPSKIKDYNL